MFNSDQNSRSNVSSPDVPDMTTMMVVKRNGNEEPVSFDKITKRINNLSKDLTNVDSIIVSQKVVAGLFHKVETHQLDDLASEISAYMTTSHPEYSILAARISVSNLHKMTDRGMQPILGLLNDCTRNFIEKNIETINSSIDYNKDFEYDFFGYKTLLKSYLLKDPNTKKTIERPQTLLMRVSASIHAWDEDLDACLESYKYMSDGYFTHATPTMFNAGTNFNQLASCFLMTVKSDSIEGIFSTVKDCALISKSAGGIGISISNVRSRGSTIKSTNGESSGILPMCQVFNHTARYVDQGGGKRKGAFAVYLEPSHPDIEEFLELKKNHGKDELRARDLFYGLWISDLFMKRVEANEDWSLFCPSKCPDLIELYGEEYERKYIEYESKNMQTKTISAQKLWFQILDSQMETGTPYMLYKDSANRKSNQKNLGTIKCSNLCTEIIEYSDENETAVCNLASIALSKFVSGKKFDFEKLGNVVEVVTGNLNKVIDQNFYPLETTKVSNNKHRPIGIGVQGLADVFFELHIPFESPEAQKLNSEIFECIYYYALKKSCSLAKKYGPYESFGGSPASQGILQFDMWENKETSKDLGFDWDTLRSDIIKFGIRNSLLLAPMPTASTSQILGNNECFEPITTNIYLRRVLAGEFPVVNKHLIKFLKEKGFWNSKVSNEIIKNKGSVKSLDCLSDYDKQVFKTVWEIKMKSVIDMAAERGRFIDQSQSMNLFMDYPTHKKLSGMHFYAWKKGLKTGMYYLRTKPASDALQVTVCDKETRECTSCSA